MSSAQNADDVIGTKRRWNVPYATLPSPSNPFRPCTGKHRSYVKQQILFRQTDRPKIVSAKNFLKPQENLLFLRTCLLYIVHLGTTAYGRPCARRCSLAHTCTRSGKPTDRKLSRRGT